MIVLDNGHKMNVFALSRAEKERRLRLIDRACSTYYLMLGSMFNTTNTWMVDAVELMKNDKRIWQGNARSGANKALSIYKEWEKRMKATLGDRFQLWLDVSDKSDAIIKPHVQNLYWAFDGVMLKEGIENHGMKAMVETAGVLAEMCVLTFDKFFDVMEKEVGVKFRDMFPRHYFAGCFNRWKDVREAIFRQGKKNDKVNIDFNKYEQCVFAYRVLEKKMVNADTYNAAGEYGLSENPELRKKYDLE